MASLLYLNDGYKGGQIRFLDSVGRRDNAFTPKIRPGSVLLFDYDCYHEGAYLPDGRKYVVRTNLMYNDKGPGSHPANP